MRHLLLLILSLTFFGSITYSQTNLKVVSNYLSAISKIKSVSYDVRRIDTFSSGTVWNHTGKCTIQRQANDTLFGFHFLGLRSDIKGRMLYDGNQLFRIDDSAKNYALYKPNRGMVGSPGGQMVVTDLMNIDKDYAKIQTYTEQNMDVIRLDFKDDVVHDATNRIKIIYLNKDTHLPVKVASSLIVLGKRGATVFNISNLKINDASIKDVDDKTDLTSYALLAPEKPAESIVGKMAIDFKGKSFEGQPFSLSGLKGKVVLIDFWETWCHACVESMPNVEMLNKKYNKKGLVVIGVTAEEKSLSTAKLLIKKKGVTYTDVVVGNDVWTKYGITAIPKYLLIDKDGKIIFESMNGYETAMENKLKEVFGL